MLTDLLEVIGMERATEFFAASTSCLDLDIAQLKATGEVRVLRRIAAAAVVPEKGYEILAGLGRVLGEE